MKKNPHLARLYAKAFHDATAGRVELAPLLPYVERAGEKLTDPKIAVDGYLKLFGDPEIPSIRRLLAILFRRKRRKLISEIVEAFNRIREETHGIRHVAVTTAFEMPASLHDRIAALLATRLGAREVRLDIAVDRALIGGMTVRVGDLVLDGSVQGALNRFRGKF